MHARLAEESLCSKSLWTNTRYWQFLKALTDSFLNQNYLIYTLYSWVMRSCYQLGCVSFIYQSHLFQSRGWQLTFTCLQTNDSHSERSICQYWEYWVFSHTYKSLLIAVFVFILTILYNLFHFKIQTSSFLSSCPHMLYKWYPLYVCHYKKSHHLHKYHIS